MYERLLFLLCAVFEPFLGALRGVFLLVFGYCMFLPYDELSKTSSLPIPAPKPYDELKPDADGGGGGGGDNCDEGSCKEPLLLRQRSARS